MKHVKTSYKNIRRTPEKVINAKNIKVTRIKKKKKDIN